MARRPKWPELSPVRRKLLLASCVLMAGLVGLDFLVEHHGAFGLDGTPAFAAWFGFVAAVFCVALAAGWISIASRNGERSDD